MKIYNLGQLIEFPNVKDVTTVASTVSTPPLSATWLTTLASVMMMEIVMLRTSVTQSLENASPSPCVSMMWNVRDMT